MIESQREAAEEGRDFDLEAELASLDAMGYVYPLPIVARVMAVWATVRAVGMAAARRLSSETFRGWEADFFVAALPMLAAADRAAERISLQRFLAAALGARR